MEIRYVKEFTQLAETLSFSLTAERSFISQATLSKHIQTLERELGAPLFHRTSRSVTLTELGCNYLPYAQEMVAAYEKSEAMRTEFLHRQAHTLVIGVVENLQLFGIHQHLINFRHQYPDIHLKIVESSNDKLYSMFRNNELNLFTSCLSGEKALDHPFYPFFFGQIVVCCPTDHPLTALPEIPLSVLRKESVILPPQNTRFFKFIEDALHANDLALLNSYDSGYEAAIPFVSAGMGIALLPSQVVGQTPPAGVAVRPLLPKLSYRCGVECGDFSHMSPAEKLFIQYIKQLPAL